jgi:hypothetical protein
VLFSNRKTLRKMAVAPLLVDKGIKLPKEIKTADA